MNKALQKKINSKPIYDVDETEVVYFKNRANSNSQSKSDLDDYVNYIINYKYRIQD